MQLEESTEIYANLVTCMELIVVFHSHSTFPCRGPHKSYHLFIITNALQRKRRKKEPAPGQQAE